MPEALPFVPAALSVAGSLIGGSSGGSSAPTPQVYQPLDATNQNQSLINLLNSNAGNTAYTDNANNYLSTFQNLYNSIYAPGAQAGANAAGAGYTATGNQELSASPQINQSAMNLLPAAQQTLNMGFDPQNALYQQNRQQLLDQLNVSNAQSGTTNSPYGASTVANATSNFDINWQQQQLQRALQSLSGAGTAVGQAASGVNTAGALGTAGAGNILQGGTTPYTTSQTIGGNQNSALTALMQGLTGQNTLNQGTINDLLSYLGIVTGQSNTQAGVDSNTFQNQLAGASAGGIGGSILGNQLGSLFNGGSSLFSNVGSAGVPLFADAVAAA